uniref:Niban 1/2/3 domain-containing protein n=1 Tax=Myotis lucifugus TaxID=59463 RepID=G1P2E9_MYOLU
MGGRPSSPLDKRQRQHLRGKLDGARRNILNPYQPQRWEKVWRIIKNILSSHHPSKESKYHSCKLPRVREHSRLLTQLRGGGSFHLMRWVMLAHEARGCLTQEGGEVEAGREEYENGGRPLGSAALTGYTVLTSQREYLHLLDTLCPDSAGKAPGTPTAGVSTSVLLTPGRQRETPFSSAREAGHGTRTKVAEQAGEGLSGQVPTRTPKTPSALNGRQFPSQRSSRFASSDCRLNSVSACLSLTVPPSLHPALRDRGIPWAPQLLDAVHAAVLAGASAGLRAFQPEKDQLLAALERTIRPDVDQLMGLRGRVAGKLRTEVQGALECCLRRRVDAQLPRVTQTLLDMVEAALAAVQTLLAQGMDRLDRHLRGNPSGARLRKEVYAFGEMPWDPELMQACYREAERSRGRLEQLVVPFGFLGARSLVFGAQDLAQQVRPRMTVARLKMREEAEGSALGTNDGPKQGQLPRGRSPVMRMRQEQRCQNCWPGCRRVHRRACHLRMECRESDSRVLGAGSKGEDVGSIYGGLIRGPRELSVVSELKKALGASDVSCALDSCSEDPWDQAGAGEDLTGSWARGACPAHSDGFLPFCPGDLSLPQRN